MIPSPIFDAILDRGLAGGVALAEAARRELAARAASGASAEELLYEARRVLARIDPYLAVTVRDTLLAAWLAAARGPAVAAVEPEPEEPIIRQPPLPPPFGPGDEVGVPRPVVRFPSLERAARDLWERRVLTRHDFDALADDAKRAAFTVARVVTLDALDKVRRSLTEAAYEGGDKRRFTVAVNATLGEQGEAALAPHHLETVYRANVQQARAAGQEAVLRHPLVGSEFPYVLYYAAHDGRTRPEHLAMETLGLDGTGVYRRDDPIWDTFTPPWSYNCRCGLIPLTMEDAARRGVREAQEWLRTGQPPASPAWVRLPDFRPPPGWGRGRPQLVAVV